MTDTYDLRLELSRRYPAKGQDRRVGELRLTTTDPEQALAVRAELRQALPDYQIEVYSVEESRARLLAVETYPKPRPKSAEDGRYINLSSAIGALLKARDVVKGHLAAGTIPTAPQCGDIALAMLNFDLPRDAISRAGLGVEGLTVEALGFTYGVLIGACHGLEMTTDRLDAIRNDLLKADLEIREPNKRLAEAHALQDLNAIQDAGLPIYVRAVYGYLGDDSHTTDTVAPDGDPYKVIIESPQSFDDVIRWQDDHLDPVYVVRPAPDEDRLKGFRSLMTDGRSYVLKPRV